MLSLLVSMILSVRSCLRSRAELQLEVLALRHQLYVLNRSRRRPVALGMVVTRVAGLANRAGDRQTGNRHQLASSRRGWQGRGVPVGKRQAKALPRFLAAN